MRHISTMMRANAIVFISSFCVMVIELIAGRILAPYIGVSLYTWTSIIGVILAGIALGNYTGGKIADKYPSPWVLVSIFLVGGLATAAVLPTTKTFAAAYWLVDLPVMWNFTLKSCTIFLVPAFILSMVSPLVIKLALANLGQTGGIVGTIYACSTAGSILGTFVTGFYLIPSFGIRVIVWLVAAVLILTGILAWFSWSIPERWKFSSKHAMTLLVLISVIAISVAIFRAPRLWQENYTKESSYYTIRVIDYNDETGMYKALLLDRLIHSFIAIDSPTTLRYPYLKAFEEIIMYTIAKDQAPRVLHLGGGGYSLPRYLEAVYRGSVNEVVEIDPAVTQVAHEVLGLPIDTTILTYNQDARLFLMQRKTDNKYDMVVGDVFNDRYTPYHLTTLEFDKLVKANMKKGGIYLINIIDDYSRGRYLSSFVHTLRHVFDRVYLFRITGERTFAIVATDRSINLDDYRRLVWEAGNMKPVSEPVDETELDKYISDKDPILLTDDYAPTDILIPPLSPLE